MVLEWALVLLTVVVALALFLRLGPRRSAWTWAAAALVALGTITAALAWDRRTRTDEAARRAFFAALPTEGRPGGYVSSNACLACHPAQHASWHRSFHRTMTQFATAEAVKASFQGERLEVQGGTVTLERRGDEFWMLVRPHSPEQGAPEDLRIGLVTGSHHMQVFWARQGPGNVMAMVPYAYLLEDRRWVEAVDTFLVDPRFSLYPPGTWNLKCLSCHVTAGQPGRGDDGEMQSRFAEIGIGCESCHGPGEEHVRKNGSPFRRYALALAGGADPTIVNPRRLSPRRSAEVCGQCHAVNALADRERYLREGTGFEPGKDLSAHRPSLVPGDPVGAPHLEAEKADSPTFFDGHFWPDGVVRVIGREWSGVQISKCHTKGGMTCLSCHSMHDSDPVDQLARGAEGDEACLQCHGDLRANLTAHTHHPAASEGSRCYNCHMANTTYGLLKATRSHFIEVPRTATTVATGRPSACNLCHLDRSLGWTDEQLARWYGHERTTLPDDEQSVSAAALLALRGDAAQRALVASGMGWRPAQQASGTEWLPRYLSLALGDPYAAVRYVAARSLRTLPGFEDVAYDYVAPREELRRAVGAIVAREAERRRPLADPAKASRLLMGPDGSLDTGRAGEQLSRRDDRLMQISE